MCVDFQEKQVTLCEGYECFISKRQLDEIVSLNGGRPIRLFRSLLNVFFEPHVLASSSALGTRSNKPLDREVLNACIGEKLRLCTCNIPVYYYSALHTHRLHPDELRCCPLCSD